jgi:flavin-dependent dehydrogenase
MSPEILILGSGPAGSAAAGLLAMWGHDVLVLTRSAVARARLAVSVPPSTRKLFDAIGVRAAVDAAGFVRSTGHTVWWGSQQTRIEPFAGGDRGWQAIDDTLEQILSASARDAGARIEHGRWTAQDVLSRGTQYVLDCTGRSGVLARHLSLRHYEDGHRTVALVGLWHARAPFDLPDATHTVIESYADGWVWSVPDATGGRHVAVMVDPRTSDLTRERSARDVYLAEVGKTSRVAAMLRDAMLDAGPTGWDASMYHASACVHDNVLLVGDAASFVDPLSSAGVKKALASGWLAAVAVHTALRHAERRAAALSFFGEREQAVYAAFREMTAAQFAAGASGHDRPFWSDRADWPTVAHERTAAAEDDGPDVRAAFGAIRVAPELRLVRAPDLRVVSRAAVDGHEIVLQSQLASDAYPRGLRYAHDVDLAVLIDVVPLHTQVPDVLQAYTRRAGPVALPDFLAALSTLVARRWLVDPPSD